jgi:hypothetical protein
VQIEHTKENERKKERKKKNNRCTLIDKFNIIIFSFLIKSIDIYDGKNKISDHHRDGCIEDEDGLSKFSLGDVNELTIDDDNFESLVIPFV